MARRLWSGLVILFSMIGGSRGHEPGVLATAIERAKPSVVAVGTYNKTRSPAFQFRGTGFAVGDGSVVATNAHVLPRSGDPADQEVLVIAIGKGTEVQIRSATKLNVDEQHDVALLKFAGSPLPAMRLNDEARVREGEEYLLTGFPLGAGLGLFPVTHRAMIAAIVPVSMPLPNSRALDPKVVKRIRESAFPVLQLDATAYPGSSGSPLYHPSSGEVIAVINMVFVKDTKEAAISTPSGITYAIPVAHLKRLLKP